MDKSEQTGPKVRRKAEQVYLSSDYVHCSHSCCTEEAALKKKTISKYTSFSRPTTRDFEIRGKEKRKCVCLHRDISVNSRKAGNLATKLKKETSLTKRLWMNLGFYPRHFTLDPRQKPILFFTLSRAYELSLAFQHFIFMTPRQPFSAVIGWIRREIWILVI